MKRKPNAQSRNSHGTTDGFARAAEAYDRGEFAAAGSLLRQWLTAHPNDVGAQYLLGVTEFRLGRAESALAPLARAISLKPDFRQAEIARGEACLALGSDALALAAFNAGDPDCTSAEVQFLRALALQRLGQTDAACNAYLIATQLKPHFPEAWNNLGQIWLAHGESEAAIAAFAKAVHLRTEFPEAWNNLGIAASAVSGSELDALDCFRKAIECRPDFVDARFNLALHLQERDQIDEACAAYLGLLEIDPRYTKAWLNLGAVLARSGKIAEALDCYQNVLAIGELKAKAHENIGKLLSGGERFEDAQAHFDAALSLDPDSVEALVGSALNLGRLGRFADQQAQLQHAASLAPESASIQAFLAQCRLEQGEFEPARAAADQAIALGASPAVRLQRAMMLPPILSGPLAITVARQRVADELDELIAGNWRCSEQDLLKHPTNFFYLAYHGENDAGLMKNLAAAHLRLCPELARTAPRPTRRSGGRLRLGFVSRFLVNHSVGNFFNPVLEHLHRDSRFEVTVFAPAGQQDPTSDLPQVHLDPTQLENARSEIVARELDVLSYLDIGMDPFAYCLAFSRLAPVQCALHGHSDTTGIPTIDHFISSALLEPENGQDYYTENLVALPTLPMYLQAFDRAPLATRRVDTDLPEQRTYLCPMRLQKVHPDLDPLLEAILRQDAEGCIAFIDDRTLAESWRTILRQRFVDRLGKLAERIVFLPFQDSTARFRALLNHAEVLLDTPGHGGGTTCNMAFSVGAPIISLTGKTCRSRGPHAYYRMMGIEGLAHHSLDEAASTAVRIATDPRLRDHYRNLIVERRNRLLQNTEVLAAYAEAYQRLGQSAR